MDQVLNEEQLQDLYAWIDKIPLSRPKRHITRDFSDGVMAAEVVKHFFPKLVELHNYSPASSTQQKISNWSTLNRKVFSKLNFHVAEETVKRIVLSTPGVIEPVLCALRDKIDKKLERTVDNMLDLEYYDTKNQEIPHTGTANKPQPTLYFTSDMDPAVYQILQEKEQALMALQETVEILQMKVSRLEHLVYLKDMRIADLTRHLETYKAKVP
ncbi:sperm flagellar protein 1 [Myripristis murdjan]|uniref:sperm flagellar protein 1 n=1 Tax=Myripristis murdjan TaxID=586833 RepID=UPI001175DF88|nr:sperm flagellar protein 1 [Myripristis murdjan]